MRERLRSHLTYANVMSTIAVFAVVAGGSAWAASKIGTNDIQNSAVTAKKLHKHAVTKKKLKSHAVSGGKISGDQRTLWAAVQPDGTIDDQSGGIKVEAVGSGHYAVNFGKKVSGRALVVSGAKGREIADAALCNGGTGVGEDCSPTAPNDKKHVRVDTALAGSVTPATFTDFPFYIAALPK